MEFFDLSDGAESKKVSTSTEVGKNDEYGYSCNGPLDIDTFNDYLLQLMAYGEAKKIYEEGCKLENSYRDIAKKCYRIAANLGYKLAEYKLQILG